MQELSRGRPRTHGNSNRTSVLIRVLEGVNGELQTPLDPAEI